MEGAKKTAVIAALVVIVAGALFFALKQSGILGRRPNPPKWLLEQPMEKVDSQTFDLVTLQFKDWLELGEKDGLYRNPKTRKYTMAPAIECANCKSKIPDETQERSPDEQLEWMKSAKCPKCGKNPFAD